MGKLRSELSGPGGGRRARDPAVRRLACGRPSWYPDSDVIIYYRCDRVLASESTGSLARSTVTVTVGLGRDMPGSESAAAAGVRAGPPTVTGSAGPPALPGPPGGRRSTGRWVDPEGGGHCPGRADPGSGS